jgi:DnaK suppressor protein
MSKQKPDIRQRLLNLKQDLAAQSDATKSDRDPVTLDQQAVGRLSRMDAMQVQAMAAAQERQRGIDLQRIATALSRLDDDEYGYCTSCGEAIDGKRLDIDPMAILCIACANLNEKSPR